MEVKILFLIPTEYSGGFWAWETSLLIVAKVSVGHDSAKAESRSSLLGQGHAASNGRAWFRTQVFLALLRGRMPPHEFPFSRSSSRVRNFFTS